MGEESKVTEFLSASDITTKARIEHFVKQPLKYKRLFFETAPNNYHGYIMVEKENTISYVFKEWQLKNFGNSFFVKNKSIRGYTYTKTGRASTRFKQWRANKGPISFDQSGIQSVVKFIKPESLALLDDPTVMRILTPGMVGYILKGTITTIEEIFEYYIRYCIRDLKIEIKNASKLYSYMKKVDNTHDSKVILGLSDDPNAYLNHLFYNAKGYVKLKLITNAKMYTMKAHYIRKHKYDFLKASEEVIADIGERDLKDNRLIKVYRVFSEGTILSAPLAEPIVMDDMPF